LRGDGVATVDYIVLAVLIAGLVVASLAECTALDFTTRIIVTRKSTLTAQRGPTPHRKLAADLRPSSSCK
jgi:hypothetical protein